MKNFIILTLLFFPFSLKASSICSRPISREEFDLIFQATRDKFFPELKGVNIEVVTFKANSYFLKVRPVVKTLLNKRKNRSYQILLNNNLLKCPPSMEGLEAILVHELEHIVDFTHWSPSRIIKHGTHYFLSCNKRIGYERATDLKVLKKGLGEGLMHYRLWIYQWLTPKDLYLKRLIYITPEEILEIKDEGTSSF